MNTTKQKLETIEQKENKEEIRNILDLLRKSHTNREKNNNKDEEELISDTSETTIINDKDKPTETHTQKKETDEKTKNHPNEDNNNNQLKAQHIKRDTKQKQHINEPNDEHDIGKISYNFTEIQESKNITQKNSKTTELEKIFKNTTQQRTEISLHNEGIKTTKPIDFTYKQQNKSNEQIKKQTNDNNPPHTNLTETFTRKNFLPNIQKQEKEHRDYYKNNESHDETKKRKKDRLSPTQYITPKTSRTKQTPDTLEKFPKHKLRETGYETDFLPATLVSPEKIKKQMTQIQPMEIDQPLETYKKNNQDILQTEKKEEKHTILKSKVKYQKNPNLDNPDTKLIEENDSDFPTTKKLSQGILTDTNPGENDWYTIQKGKAVPEKKKPKKYP